MTNIGILIAGIAGALGMYAGGWLGLLAVVIAIIGTYNYK